MDPVESESVRGRHPKTGWALTVLGWALMIWGVLHLTSATIGGRIDGFENRRTYNEIKTRAHDVYPGTLLRGGIGFLLVLAGSRLRGPARG